MKKTTKTVFARVLSLALVMALVLTSIVSSFAFTASAEDVKEFTGNFIDFENDGNVPDGMTLDVGGYYSIAKSPTDSESYSLKRSYGSGNVTFRIYKKFTAGYKYSFSIDYYFEANTESYAKYTPWFNVYVGSEAASGGTYNGSNYGKWVKASITYEPKKDATYCDLICAEVDAYFDNIKIVENTNTAAKQSYDFDNISPTGGNGFNLVTTDDNNVAMKLSYTSAANKDHIFNFDYNLTTDKMYKISFDYKGSVKARPYVFSAKDGQWASRQCLSLFGDTEFVLKSEDWTHWETTFYADYDYSGIDFLLVHTNVITDIATDFCYIDNFVVEEYTPGVDKYEVDFEDGKTFAGGCSNYVGDGVVTDPLDSNNKVLYKVASGNTIRQYYIMTPRLLAGHSYAVSFRAYGAEGSWTGFEKRGYSPKPDQKGLNGTGKWETYTYTFTPTWDDDYFCFNGKDALYIDDFKIVDLTTDNDYYEDFSKPDAITILGNTNVNIEYVKDENLGKNIAVVTWPSTPNIDGQKIKVPYVLKNGVQYRVKVTYKNSGWWCPSYNGAVQGGAGSHSSPNNWQAQYWYITGSGESDYFMLTTNVANLTLQIKDIKIEKMTGVNGDLSNDGNVDANDLAMVKRVLLDFMDDDVFMKAGDVNGDGQYNILDFIALKKSITPVPTVVDEAVSVNEVAYASSNIAVDKTGASIFGDSSSFKTAVSGEDAYLIYELRGGITEAAVEYHVSANFMGDFIFEVSRDAKKWTTITASDIAKEEINSNSYVRVTEYFGNLGYYSYLKITFPEISAEKGEENYFAEIRKVQINGLDAKALYDMCGYNSALREPQTIYVSNSGNDNNNGLSEAAPVKTLEAAFGRMFVPGDKVLLKKGDTFTGEVKILTSGTKEAPIVIGSYGVGEKPIITGFDDVAITVTGEYVEIENIAFTCETALSGIRFYALKDAQLYGANSGVKVSGCSFYKINSVADGKRSHNRDTGGIAFKASGNKPAWFDGITVENNSFDTVARNAVLTTSDWAARDITQTWGKKNFALENNPVFLSKNILIKNNSIKNNGGDAITLIGSDGAIIEYNTVANSALLYNYNYKKENGEYVLDKNGNRVISNVAWASIWCHSSDNCVIQYNEVYGNRADNKGQDLQAFDIDLACNNCVVQYNYSHDNAGGFMLLCGVDSADNGGVSGAIVRYNLSVNDGGANMYVFDITGSVSDSQIYNNTIYCGNNNVRLVNFANYARATVKSSNTVFTNNIFYAEKDVTVKWGYGDSVTTPALQNATFKNNVFYNIDEPTYRFLLVGKDLFDVSGSIYTDPQFVNGGAENNDLANGNNYKVQNTELLNSGLVIENNGGKDYFGSAISANSTLMGAIS